MSIPILEIDNLLIISIQIDLGDTEAAQLQEDLLERLAETGARGILLDLTAVETVDSYLGRVIRDTAAMAHLMGAATALVGMRPAVAITFVELGLKLPQVHTDLNLERGLAWLRRQA